MNALIVDILGRHGLRDAQSFRTELGCANPTRLSRLFAAVARSFQEPHCKIAPADLAALESVDPEVDWSLWSVSDLARLLVLRGGVEAESTFLDRVERFFDLAENIACARSLALVPNPASQVSRAEEFCRANMKDVFSAMAHGNPYPARYFDDRAFNHMILKALFMEVPLDPVVGLGDRMNDETLRMARDYTDELRAAGRDLPHDLSRLSIEETAT